MDEAMMLNIDGDTGHAEPLTLTEALAIAQMEIDGLRHTNQEFGAMLRQHQEMVQMVHAENERVRRQLAAERAANAEIQRESAALRGQLEAVTRDRDLWQKSEGECDALAVARASDQQVFNSRFSYRLSHNSCSSHHQLIPTIPCH